MPADPWLSLIGLGEDGPAGLPEASRAALAGAEVVFGGPRHLSLIGGDGRGRAWPVPFSPAPVLALRGRRVAVLASGDPFWHGVGATLARHLDPGEWRAFPAPSTFSLAASRLGWRLEEVACIGLHAAPLERLVPLLSPGRRILCLMRDGDAPAALADWLAAQGFGASELTVMEALGGPRERLRSTLAGGFDLTGVDTPVAVAVIARGAPGLPATPGRREALFAHDGQITKGFVRALTLAALAPRAGERLWDLGAGSGSVSVEWCLAAPGTTADAVEARPDRIANIDRNAAAFGIGDRLARHPGYAREIVTALPVPAAVFIGGGADAALIELLWRILPEGTRITASAVTLETEALFTGCAARLGGSLHRFDLSEAVPLGRMRGWQAARAVTQWSVTR